MTFAAFFIFYSTASQKMDHFDISFACSFFSKSWEVTKYGFLDVAHLALSPDQRILLAVGVITHDLELRCTR